MDKRTWSKSEIQIVKKFYKNFGSKRCAKALKRTISSIVQKAVSLGIKRNIFGESNPNWVGKKAKPGTGNARARYWFKVGKCSKCGKSGHDRHHKDGDPMNNDKSNICILCRSCHMKEDGRLKRLHIAHLRSIRRIK